MAFPLKSGADLYNQQLIRAAIWNYSAEIIDPKEYATGLMYFNTNPASNLYQKLRFRTSTEWKTIAFEEDLDVANNAEFKALEDKVKLLAGEVDTDAIISNMKEVSNFLAGFAEDANLMSVLDGKLDKSGGTISGAGTIDIRRSEGPYSSIIKFSNKSSVLGYIGFNSEKSFSVWSDLDSSPYTLLHSGNIGSQNVGSANMLKYIGNISSSFNANTDLAGGGLIPNYNNVAWWGSSVPSTLSYGVVCQLQGSPSDANLAGQLAWDVNHRGADSTRALWWRANDDTNFANAKWHQIAFTDSNVASATKLQTARTIWGQSFDGTGNVSGTLSLGNDAIHGGVSSVNILWCNHTDTLYLGYGMCGVGGSVICGNAIAMRYGSSRVLGFMLNSSGNVTIGSEDKAGKSAKLYVGGRAVATGGFYIADSSDSYEAVQLNPAYGLYIGYGTSGKYNTLLWGQNIKFVTGANGQTRLYIANGGNVGIGIVDPQYKLDVDGIGRFSVGMSANEIILGSAGIYKGSYYTTALSDSDILYNARYHVFNGNVGIGLTNPSAQLHVAQDIVANGTIACKGIAAEGSEVGMGTVDKKVLYISSSTTQQTFSLTHGLNTREITVCIYEVTSTGTNMILTDVEITGDNTISVSFGNPPTENHMVVVMG